MPYGMTWWNENNLLKSPPRVGRPKRDRKKQKRRASGR